MTDVENGGASRPSADEESPLLGNGHKAVPDNGTIERGDGPAGGSNGVGETDVPIAKEPTARELLPILMCTWFGSFLAALDSTVIATLTAPISTSFNSLGLMSWLATAYLIANAALQPLSGRLTDILGRRAGLIFSNIFFCLGNLICGLAQEEWVMILGRVVAGMGGGGLTAISTFVSSDLVPLRQRGVYQGFGNISYGLGMGIGGVFGGWMNDTLGWRWAFLLQVPFCIISGCIVSFTVRIPVKETGISPLKRIDYLGAITLVTSLVLLLLGLNSGGNLVPWTHPLVLASLPAAAAMLLLFIYIEERVASEPIIPVRLLLHRTVFSACVTNWFGVMSVFSLLFYGPIYFQVRGFSATAAGVRLIPQSIGTAVGSVGAGVIMRKTGRYTLLNVFVQGTAVISAALIASMDLSTPVWPPFIYFFLEGAGYGAMLTVTLLALIAAVSHEHQAVATSASYAFCSTGGTIGITVSGTVFQNILRMRLWSRFGNEKNAAEVIGKLRESFDEIRHVPEGWEDGVLDCYMGALKGVFYTALGFAALSMLVSLLMRQHTLHRTLDRK